MGWFSTSCCICNDDIVNKVRNKDCQSFRLIKSMIIKEDSIQSSDGQKILLKNGEVINPVFLARFGDSYCYWIDPHSPTKVDICSRTCAKKYTSNNKCCVMMPVEAYPGFELITPDTETHDRYAHDNNLPKRAMQRGSS